MSGRVSLKTAHNVYASTTKPKIVPIDTKVFFVFVFFVTVVVFPGRTRPIFTCMRRLYTWLHTLST